MTTTESQLLTHLKSRLPKGPVHISKLRSVLIPFEATAIHRAFPGIPPQALSTSLKQMKEEGHIETFDLDLMPIFVPAGAIEIDGHGKLDNRNINFANRI